MGTEAAKMDPVIEGVCLVLKACALFVALMLLCGAVFVGSSEVVRAILTGSFRWPQSVAQLVLLVVWILQTRWCLLVFFLQRREKSFLKLFMGVFVSLLAGFLLIAPRLYA